MTDTKDEKQKPPKEYREAGATKGSDYADSENFKYPIDTEAHVRAAISYFSKPKNAEAYPVSKRRRMWGKIKSAAKRFKIELGEGTGKVSKSLDSIDSLESMLTLPVAMENIDVATSAGNEFVHQVQPTLSPSDTFPSFWRQWEGFDIAVEARGGEPRKNGTTVPASWIGYGYFCGVMGDDGDYLDVCLGPDFDNSFPPNACALKIQHGDSQWKVMLGFKDSQVAEREALQLWSGATVLESAFCTEGTAFIGANLLPAFALIHEDKKAGNAEYFGDKPGMAKEPASPPALTPGDVLRILNEEANCTPELRLSPNLNGDMDYDDGAIALQFPTPPAEFDGPTPTVVPHPRAKLAADISHAAGGYYPASNTTGLPGIMPLAKSEKGNDMSNKFVKSDGAAIAAGSGEQGVPSMVNHPRPEAGTSEMFVRTMPSMDSYFEGLLVLLPEDVMQGEAKGTNPEWEPSMPPMRPDGPANIPEGVPAHVPVGPKAQTPGGSNAEAFSPSGAPEIPADVQYGAFWLTAPSPDFDNMVKGGDLVEAAETAQSMAGSGLAKSDSCGNCNSSIPAHLTKCMACGYDKSLSKSFGAPAQADQHFKRGVLDFDETIARFLLSDW